MKYRGPRKEWNYADKTTRNFLTYADLPSEKKYIPPKMNDNSKKRLEIHEYISKRISELIIENKLSKAEIVECIVKECLLNKEWADLYKTLQETSGKSIEDIYSGFVNSKLRGTENKTRTSHDTREDER